MIDNDTLLMISIFEQVRSLEPKPTTPEQYLKSFFPEIDGVGRLLELLGLAEKSDTCALGWKPTEALLRLIANRLVEPSDHNENINHRQLIEFMFKFAIRDLGVTDVDDKDNMFVEQVTEFGCELFDILGLAETDETGSKPTHLLQELVFKRYLETASKNLQESERGTHVSNIA
jgi:hypothetical protein